MRGKQGSSSFSHFGGEKSARKVFISTGLKDFLAKVLTSSFTLPPLIRKSKKVLSGGPTDLALFAQVRGAKKPGYFFAPTMDRPILFQHGRNMAAVSFRRKCTARRKRGGGGGRVNPLHFRPRSIFPEEEEKVFSSFFFVEIDSSFYGKGRKGEGTFFGGKLIRE